MAADLPRHALALQLEHVAVLVGVLIKIVEAHFELLLKVVPEIVPLLWRASGWMQGWWFRW